MNVTRSWVKSLLSADVSVRSLDVGAPGIRVMRRTERGEDVVDAESTAEGSDETAAMASSSVMRRLSLRTLVSWLAWVRAVITSSRASFSSSDSRDASATEGGMEESSSECGTWRISATNRCLSARAARIMWSLRRNFSSGVKTGSAVRTAPCETTTSVGSMSGVPSAIFRISTRWRRRCGAGDVAADPGLAGLASVSPVFLPLLLSSTEKMFWC